MYRAILFAGLLAVGGGLTGCATTSAVLSEAPEEVIHSTQSVQEISACFEHKHLRVIERPDGARVVRFRNGYGGVTRALSFYGEPGGTRVEIRKGSFGPVGSWKRCVGVR